MTDTAPPSPYDKPDPVTRLIAAMAEHGAASAADLAQAAGMGYSTTTTKLRILEADGRAEKIRTDDRRTLWRLTPNGQPPQSTLMDGGQADGGLPDTEPAPDTNIAAARSDVDGATDGHAVDAPADDAQPDPPLTAADGDKVPEAARAAPLPGTGHPGSGTTAAPDTAPGSDAEVAGTEVAAAPDTGTAAAEPRPRTGRSRRRKGQLRDEVLAVLQSAPDHTFGATALSHRLDGASQGAIANALDKLVTDGSAHLAQDKPARWQAT